MAKEAYIVQEADRIPLTLGSNADVGDVLQIGSDMVGVAATSGLAGETVTVYVGGVVVEVEGALADDITVGTQLYFDHINRVLTVKSDSVGDGTGTPFNPAGHAVTAKAANVAGVVQILLNK